jgi:methylated-DNA-protein-cysteine methyltransferase-like protein
MGKSKPAKRRLRERPSDRRVLGDDNQRCILMVIAQIPYGKVATYGQIAKLAGIPRNARQVGAVLRSLPNGSGIPWYRVVNSRGEISQRDDPASHQRQRQFLENESVVFDVNDRIPLIQYGWKP